MSLSVVTPPIGGTIVEAGGTLTQVVALVGATSSMSVAISPLTYPGDGIVWQGFISAPDTVTVKISKILAGEIPAAQYNVVATGGGSGSTITLETNSTPNPDQTLLNLKDGTNVTITDDGVGGITIAASGGALDLEVNGVQNVDQTLLNLISGAHVTLTDNGAGGITIAVAGITLETNGTPNGSQTLLNLKQGAHITVADDGLGGITITGTAAGPTLETNGTPNGSQTLLNLKQGANITVADDGLGGITITGAAAGPALQTNGSPNGDQVLLNLKQGSNITLTDDGVGGVTITGLATVTHSAGALTLDQPVFGNAGGDIKVGTKTGNTNALATATGATTANVPLLYDASGNVIVSTRSGNTTKFVTTTGALTTGDVAIWDASGNLIDGGAPGIGTVTHTGALTVDLPMFGNGTADSKVGTKSGNTDELATVTGALTSGHLATWDASGNLIDGGAVPAGGPTTQAQVVGSRSLGTVFHNTTGKTMWVSVTVNNGSGTNNSCSCFTDASNPPTTDVAGFFQQPNGAGLWSNNVTFLVLAGNFYMVTNNGQAGQTLSRWVEWS